MTLLQYKVIILDFDGVLVESNAIKDKAFEALFALYPEHLPAILDYHRSHAVIRFKKFRHIYEHILKRPYTPRIEAALNTSFSDFCVEAVIQSPEVKGARGFLEYFHGRIPLYLVSINPAEDLARILKARSLAGFFKKVYTTEGSKTGAIHDILRSENMRASQTVFIGDSSGDYQSARQAGVFFIGRQAQQDFKANDFPLFNNMSEILDFLCEVK